MKKMENKNIKLKVEIEIPELNLKGEMKPLKSNELLYQFEEILIENGLSYRLCTSAYTESDENGEA